MLSQDALMELRTICEGSKRMTEGGYIFVYLPSLRVRAERVMDALLCIQPRDGYTTRLYLAEHIQGHANNWTAHRILDRTWYTWSWNNVSSELRPAQILAEHLRALR